VAGLDAQVVALSQPFYLLYPNDRQPVLLPGQNQDRAGQNMFTVREMQLAGKR
jgi:hypothetical protein